MFTQAGPGVPELPSPLPIASWLGYGQDPAKAGTTPLTSATCTSTFPSYFPHSRIKPF